MEKDLKFSSAICTDRNQSERLLALGLKKETADCCYYYYDGEYLIAFAEDAKYPSDIPAWSLHRLIELAYGNWEEDIVPVYLGNSYDMLIGRIEFQIKQGKFNKEYLV